MAIKHKSPSRIRYEEKTAVVSARLPKEQKEMLDTFLKIENYSSFAEWLKDFLDKDTNQQNSNLQNLHGAYIEGYREGVKYGIVNFIGQEFLSINNKNHGLDKTMAWVVFDTAKKIYGKKKFDRDEWQEIICLLLDGDEWVEEWIEGAIDNRK